MKKPVPGRSPVKLMIAAAALLAIAGCSLFDGDEARVRVMAVLPAPHAPATLHVLLADGPSIWKLEGDDFVPRGGGYLIGPELSTVMHGTLSCLFELRGDGGAVLSRGAVDLPLRRDWAWSIIVQPDTTDPALRCFGCFGSRAFALDPAFGSPAADSVYVVWGGNSIKNPVVY